MELTNYDPRLKFPELTELGTQRLRDCITRNTKDSATEVMQLICFIAEAVLAAATSNPIKTVGEVWEVVYFRVDDPRHKVGHPQREILQNDFMTAARRVVALMSD